MLTSLMQLVGSVWIVIPVWMYLVLLDMMEALAKIGAACNSLLQYDLEELGALVTIEAYCNFSIQEFSAVKVA